MDRVQKLIANSGYGSRRKAEELILKKKVLINGMVANLGDKASLSDEILVEGNPIGYESKEDCVV